MRLVTVPLLNEKKAVFTQPSIKRCGYMRHFLIILLNGSQNCCNSTRQNGGQPFLSNSIFFTIRNLLGYKRAEDLSDFSSHPNLTSVSRISAKNDLQDSYRHKNHQVVFFSNGSESFLFFTWPGRRWMISLVKEFSVYISP